jgi:hypothetical protein
VHARTDAQAEAAAAALRAAYEVGEDGVSGPIVHDRIGVRT